MILGIIIIILAVHLCKNCVSVPNRTHCKRKLKKKNIHHVSKFQSKVFDGKRHTKKPWHYSNFNFKFQQLYSKGI